MPTVLITGCDRGIGREFARQYDDAGFQVIATCHDPANAFTDRPRIRNQPLDVTDFAQFDALARTIGDEPIDLLVSNAGIGLDTRALGAIDFGYVNRMLAVNTVGALKLVETFTENVAAGSLRRVALVTSRMGSIASNLSGGHYGYRASKAALNAIGRSLALDLFPRGIVVVMIHPGWVDTAGGGESAALGVEESVAGMRDVIRRLGNHETGEFLNHAGQRLPW